MTPEERIGQLERELEERVAALERFALDIQTQLDAVSDWLQDVAAGLA